MKIKKTLKKTKRKPQKKKKLKQTKKNRGLQGVPSQTAQKKMFFKRNVARNRAAIEVQKTDFELKKKK